jgi:hypothetical protein
MSQTVTLFYTKACPICSFIDTQTKAWAKSKNILYFKREAQPTDKSIPGVPALFITHEDKPYLFVGENCLRQLKKLIDGEK